MNVSGTGELVDGVASGALPDTTGTAGLSVGHPTAGMAVVYAPGQGTRSVSPAATGPSLVASDLVAKPGVPDGDQDVEMEVVDVGILEDQYNQVTQQSVRNWMTTMSQGATSITLIKNETVNNYCPGIAVEDVRNMVHRALTQVTETANQQWNQRDFIIQLARTVQEFKMEVELVCHGIMSQVSGCAGRITSTQNGCCKMWNNVVKLIEWYKKIYNNVRAISDDIRNIKSKKIGRAHV